MAERIKVWDLAVRVFHWSLVLLFVAAYVSGESESRQHIYAGYGIAGLLLFRLLWGFVGGRYARFKAFLYSPAETLAYVRASWHGKSRHYLSHNPLGALMVFALLLTLSGTVLSGLALTGDLPGQRAAAMQTGDERHDDESHAYENHGDESHDDENHTGDNANESASVAHANHEQWEEVHEFFANFTVLLVALHVFGVAMASRFHKEKLVPAMITGWKEPSDHNG